MVAMQGFTFLTRSVDFPQTASGQKITMRRQDLVGNFGPRNRPIVIDRIVLHARAAITVATTAVAGEDVWRSLRNVTLMQTDKAPRINAVHGDALRIAMIDKAGVECIKEHSDWTVGTATYLLTFPIELACRQSYDEDDLAMPGEMLDYLEFTGIETGVNGPGVAGGTLTLGAITWYAVVEGREVPYSLVNPYDVIETTSFGSSNDLNKIINGRLHALYLRRPGADGGATMPNITQISVDELGRIGLAPDLDLREFYDRTRGQVTGSNAANPGVALRNDPVGLGRAIPIVFSGKRSKVTGAYDLTTLQIRTLQSSAYTDLQALTRTVLPPRRENIALMEAAHGRGGEWTLKTRDKTAKDPKKWGAEGRYLPIKRNLTAFR